MRIRGFVFAHNLISPKRSLERRIRSSVLATGARRGATNKELRVSDGRETVSAPGDREPNVQGHLVNARGVKSPMEVSSKGILVFDHRLSLRATERSV